MANELIHNSGRYRLVTSLASNEASNESDTFMSLPGESSYLRFLDELASQPWNRSIIDNFRWAYSLPTDAVKKRNAIARELQSGRIKLLKVNNEEQDRSYGFADEKEQPRPRPQQGLQTKKSEPPVQEKQQQEPPKRYKVAIELGLADSAVLSNEELSLHLSESNKAVGNIGLARAKNDRHRSEVVFEDLQEGKYDLFVNIKSKDGHVNHIPLVKEFDSVAKSTKQEMWDTVLLPVRLLRYASEAANKDETAMVEPGWVYVFKDGKLWRELEIINETGYMPGLLREVDLAFEAGKDVRLADSQIQNTLLLPYKINGETPAIEICYAPVQWSWSYVCAMGGMDDDDPRLVGAAQKRVQQNTGSEQSGLRDKRMQTLDLSAYEGASGFAKKPHIGGIEQFSQGGSASLDDPDKDILRSIKDSGMGVVYLFDPLSIADQYDMEIIRAYESVLKTKSEAMSEPRYYMASMVRQLTHMEKDLRKYIDEQEVEQVLHWDEYLSNLEKLDAAINRLGSFMRRRNYHPNIEDLAHEYWHHSDERYLEGVERIADWLEHISMGNGFTYLEQFFDEDESYIAPMFEPSEEQKNSLVTSNLNFSAKVVESLAAASTVNEKVKQVLFEYMQTMTVAISDGEYTLSIERVNLSQHLKQVDAKVTPPKLLEEQYVLASKGDLAVEMWLTTAASSQSRAVEQPIRLGQGAQWLKDNEILVKKNAIRFFGVLETLNLVGAYTRYDKSIKSKSEVYASFSSLVSLGFEYFKDVKKVGAGWETAPLTMRDSLKFKRIGITIATHGFAFIGNSLTTVVHGMEAHKQWHRGDHSTAAVAAISAFGALNMTVAGALAGAAELGKLGVGPGVLRSIGSWNKPMFRLGGAVRGLAITRLAMWNLIGLAIGLIGTILYSIIYKTALEQWCIHGPFGKDASLRYLSPLQGGEKKWLAWKDNAKAEAELLGLLYSLRFSYCYQRSDRDRYVVKLRFHFPVANPGKTCLHFECYDMNPIYDQAGIRQVNRQGDLINNAVAMEFNKDENGIYFVELEIPQVKLDTQIQIHALVDINGDGTLLVPLEYDESNPVSVKPLIRNIAISRDVSSSGWIDG